MPLFSRFQVESYLSAMFNPVVQLKSGGYIVIDVTEALVAIDVNSGRATREASIEDTALKTNLEAAEEAARQMRLRDLAGLIVIDFIDMEDRKNNAAVEKRLKDKLKTDRARIQVGRISPFGLLEMSRQRLRPGMIEATTKGCPHCHGTGRVRSDDSLALALLREVEEEGVKARSKEVLIVAPVEIANYLLNQKREHVAMIEQRFGLSVRVEGDASLISPDYKLEKFKTASRIVPAPERLELTTVAYPAEEEIEEEEAEEEAEEEVAEAPEAAGEKPGGKRKRRRRRRGGKPGQAAPAEAAAEPVAEESPADEPAEAARGAGGRGGRAGAGTDAVAAPVAQGAGGGGDAGAGRRSRAGAGGRGTVAVRRDDRPRRADGARDRRGPRGRRAAAPLARAGAQAGDRGAGRGGVGDGRGDHAGGTRPSTSPSPSRAEPEAAAAEPEPAEAASSKAEEGPKRRGWWSRALSGS